MRILALHNSAAGTQDHDGGHLADHLRSHGHEVVQVVRQQEELERALRDRGCDLIVVAGGDGTVNKAARVARGTTIPIAILPRGTANNLARTMRVSAGVQGGLESEVSDLIATWPSLAPRSCDAALATWTVEVTDGAPVPLAQRPFFECFGFGAFCQSMATASAGHEASPARSAEEKLARDRETLRRSVATAPAVDYRVEVDGVDHSGTYLMVEVMLIPFLGPRVEVAPGAGAGDGHADVVLVTEAERDALLRHIERDEPAPRPDAWRPRPLRGSSVRIASGAPQAPSHADGKLCAGEDGEPLAGPVRIDVTADSYRVLAPR